MARNRAPGGRRPVVDFWLCPTAARFDLKAREFLLTYDELRAMARPDDMLLRFFQTAYEAAADLGRWDRAALDRS